MAQSFAKNMGLYGERVGAFHLVTSSASAATHSRSQLARLQRGEISTPPVYGARIAATVLGDAALFAEWKADLQTMSGRIRDMRHALYDELCRLRTPGKWDHIVKQIGMFSYTGLNAQQAKMLGDEYSIYLLDSGRISIAGREFSPIANSLFISSSLPCSIHPCNPSYIYKPPEIWCRWLTHCTYVFSQHKECLLRCEGH